MREVVYEIQTYGKESKKWLPIFCDDFDDYEETKAYALKKAEENRNVHYAVVKRVIEETREFTVCVCDKEVTINPRIA